MKKINVMLVTNNLGIGCSEKTIQIFTKYIDKDIFNLSICCLYEGGIREKYIEKYGIPIYKIKGDLGKFIKIIQENRIDILNVNNLDYAFLKHARPIIPVIIETSIFGSTANFMVEEKGIDFIYFISKMITIRYYEKLNLSIEKMKAKSNIIYNPIDFETIKTDYGKEIAQLKEKLGINPNTFIIGKIGRKDRTKWSNFIIEIIYHLQKKHKNFKIILIGAPLEIQNEINRRKLGRFFILFKHISEDQLEIFYELIDCLVHSSKIGESFGCTLAEAMAHKKPIIVNSTPLRDNAQIELVDNKRTGFIVNYPENGAQAIHLLLENKKLRDKLGQNGFQKAFDQFNANNIRKYLEKIYITNLAKKKLIDQQIINKYQDIQIKTDINNLEQFEIEYRGRLNDSYGNLTLFQNMKYLFRTFAEMFNIVINKILIPIALFPIYLVKKNKNKIPKKELFFNIKKVYYFLHAILRRKYYEVLFI